MGCQKRDASHRKPILTGATTGSVHDEVESLGPQARQAVQHLLQRLRGVALRAVQLALDAQRMGVR